MKDSAIGGQSIRPCHVQPYRLPLTVTAKNLAQNRLQGPENAINFADQHPSAMLTLATPDASVPLEERAS
jgi:hypothetical protein